MSRPGPAFELEVVTDGNVVLRERLTRALRAELNKVDGVEVEFAPVMSASAGAKSGSAIGDLALWVFLGTAMKVTAQVVIEKIKAWSEKERNRTVRITRGNETIEIPGNPDETQERLIRKFLEGGRS
ncbi:MAG: hypothetical protein ACRDRI_17025 [Pseudonocardiaceae bacterium]